jgi:hypothetical protein
MDRVRCPECGSEHDLSEMEPHFDRPDAYFDIPAEERAARSASGDSHCVIWERADAPRRHFLRVVLPVPVRGALEAFCWGVWVEVDELSYRRTQALWRAARQAGESPFAATLANNLPDMAPTLGLPGQVSLTGPVTIPAFRLDTGVAHPLAAEQRDGVFPERLVEWLSAALHP